MDLLKRRREYEEYHETKAELEASEYPAGYCVIKEMDCKFADTKRSREEWGWDTHTECTYKDGEVCVYEEEEETP